MKNKKVEPRQCISWDECFMRMAHTIAERSKDPSTQAGAIIVNNRNVVLGAGYNGFPRGIDSNIFPWEKEGNFEDTKYAYVCHAEENAIYNTYGDTEGAKIYCTLFPCNECAKAIIQKGIKEVIYESDKYADTPSVKVSKKMFKVAKIKTRFYKREI